MTPSVGSLFAGVGGFDLGFERAGFRVAWHAEIEPHASAILRHRWPDVPNAGDVKQIHGGLLEPVDVICGGFPCQDLSVAGKRAGLRGTRSSLAFDFIRIVREMREATDGQSPAFVVLENVPGLFSSHGGRDFGVLLDALGELRPVDLCWRVLDSRYFGVAQRRRRVFVVLDLAGERAEQVLVEPESLRGDPAAGRAAREDLAHTLRDSSKRGSDDTFRMTFVPDVAYALACHAAKGGDPSTDNYVAQSIGVLAFDTVNITSKTNRSNPKPGDPCHTLHHAAPTLAGVGVRRLTATECERLQGFPDGWTATGTKPDGTDYSLADGPRYRCLGNAVTVNVANWIASRMRSVL